METSLEQYILNPMGKNNAVLNSLTRETLRKSYTIRFDNLMLREKGNIRYKLYYDEKNNQCWAHIKVPSETVSNFFYDIVFKFFTNASEGGQNDLFKWNVQFYSNDPAFVFTYAHVFNKNGLFIPELQRKMSKQAIKKAAEQKNPNEVIGYVKTIFFAYLIMDNKGINKLSRFKGESKPLSPRALLNEIEDADTKIDARIEEGRHVSHRKKLVLDQNTLKNVARHVGKSEVNTDNIRVTTSSRVSKLTNMNNVVKKTKTVGKVNRK